MIDGIARYFIFKTINLTEEIQMQVLSHSQYLEIEINVKEPYKVKSKKITFVKYKYIKYKKIFDI